MNKKTWIALGALLLVVAILVGVYFATKPQPQEGSKTITVEIVHADGKTETVECHTDEEYLDHVLVAEGLIEESNIVDGYFDTVRGETASWTENKSYWAFYINGEYATVGICEAIVEDGATYKLAYEISNY